MIEQFQPLTGRLSPMFLPCGAVVLRDEFNPTLPTLEAALRAQRIEARSRNIVLPCRPTPSLTAPSRPLVLVWCPALELTTAPLKTC